MLFQGLPLIMTRMLKLISIFLIIFLSTACSEQDHPLTASKKAKLVNELIIDNARCSIFKNRLVSPSLQSDEIDDVYHDALKARCVNKDI